MAREVTVGPDGLATGVSYIDKNTGADEHVRAKVVVLAASAWRRRGCCSTRSRRSSRTGSPTRAASVGQVSHRHDRRGRVRIHSGDGGPHAAQSRRRGRHARLHAVVARQQEARLPARLPHRSVRRRRVSRASGFGGGIQRRNGGGYGKQLKADYRKYYGASIGFDGRGEMIPNDDSYCELDPNVGRSLRHSRAALPLEVQRLRVQPGEAHAGDLPRAHRRDGRHADVADADAASRATASPTGGTIIHELGGARMGNDPKTSVVNANCQAHDVKNLFVADGSPFVSQADKNPTWTILALSWRTSDYIAQQRKAGAL